MDYGVVVVPAEVYETTNWMEAHNKKRPMSICPLLALCSSARQKDAAAPAQANTRAKLIE